MAPFDDKSLEELEAMIRNPELIPPEAVEPEPEPTPEPAPEPSTPEPETPTAEPEAPTPTEPEPEVSELDILRAMLEKQEAQSQKLQAQLGRFAGEADFWRKKAERTVTPEPRQDSDPTDEPIEAPAPKTQPSRDEFTTWAVAQAAQQAVVQFAAGHPDFKELDSEIKEYFEKSGFNPEKVLLASGPIEAAREVTRALEEAHWHAKAAKAAARIEELKTRQSTQFARQSEAKKRATISSSGSTPPPAAKPKTLNDLSQQELEAELRRLTARQR